MANRRLLAIASRTAGLIVTAFWLGAAASSAYAQLPTAQLTSVFPAGGKPGTTFDVTLTGRDIDDAGQLVFTQPGITAVQKIGAENPFFKSKSPLQGQFTVTIPAATPPGIYEVRTIGRFGASNPRSFVVGTLDEVPDKDPAATAATARVVPLESTVSGAVRPERADFYKFTAHKAQRIVIDCLAQRIDSRLDATLVLFDAKNHELARGRQHIRRDPVLDFTAPADGDYVLKVYDFLYKGGNEYFYRLTLSAKPYLDFIMPPAGQRGTTGKYFLFGRNLPGGAPSGLTAADGKPLDKLEVEIALPADSASAAPQPGRLVDPTEAAVEAFSYRLPPPQGPSVNAADVFYVNAPIVPEQEPNDTPATAQKISPPCEIVGQFNPRGDQDWFAFDAKKGEVYWIEVYSQRLGLPTDPYLLVQRAVKGGDGKETYNDVADDDDPRPNPKHDRFETHYSALGNDPVLRFVAPDDGSYRLLVRDMYYESRGNPGYVYRLSVRRNQPDFRLTAVIESPVEPQNGNRTQLWSPVIHKGEVTGVTVLAARRDDFNGDIQVSVDGLPPGITCPGAIIGPGADVGTLVFSASPDVAAWSGAIKVIGHATIDGHDVAHEANIGTVVWGTENREQQKARFRLTSQMYLASSPADTPLVKVELGDDKVLDTCVGGKLDIPVKLVRHGEFKGRAKLYPAGLPREINIPEMDLAENVNDGKLHIEVRNVPPGVYTMSCRVETRLRYRHNPEAAAAAADQSKAMEKIAADIAAAAKTAGDAKNAAERAANDAANQAKQAADAATAAQQALPGAESRLKTAMDAKAAADKVATEAQAKAQAAMSAKAAADKAVAAAKDPKDPKAKPTLEAQASADAAAKQAADQSSQAAAKLAAAQKAAQDATTAFDAAKAATAAA